MSSLLLLALGMGRKLAQIATTLLSLLLSLGDYLPNGVDMGLEPANGSVDFDSVAPLKWTFLLNSMGFLVVAC